MEAIKINKERLEQILPQNIIETDVLSKDAKKVLAVIINYHFVQTKAKESGFLAISNETLVKATELKSSKRLLTALQELIDCNLIVRNAGKTWQKGIAKKASEYYVKWEELKKPIKKATFDDLLADFLKTSKTPGMPISTTITIPISIPDSKPISKPTSIPVSTPDSIATSTSSDYKKIEESIKQDELMKDEIKKQFESWSKKVNEQRQSIKGSEFVEETLII